MKGLKAPPKQDWSGSTTEAGGEAEEVGSGRYLLRTEVLAIGTCAPHEGRENSEVPTYQGLRGLRQRLAALMMGLMADGMMASLSKVGCAMNVRLSVDLQFLKNRFESDC